ncbi:MAG: hypothetical protein AseanaTS_03830 [Candidatus Pelagadaptatus aseana]
MVNLVAKSEIRVVKIQAGEFSRNQGPGLVPYNDYSGAFINKKRTNPRVR